MNQLINQSTKRPTFLEGVGVAVAVSVLGSASAMVLTSLFGRGVTLYLLAAVVGFTYLVYLLARSRQRVGRITTVVFWLSATAIAWFTAVPLVVFTVMQLGFLWLVRSLYFHASVLSALLDLGLTAFSLITALWALVHTGSVFLGIWTFFLLQALFVVIPRKMQTDNGNTKAHLEDDSFQLAYRSAEAAVRKLSTLR